MTVVLTHCFKLLFSTCYL